ncbi:MAG: cytosine permease [Rubrobacteraceae bacterium]|jgi:cytosine permease|nr:cytosine permease [Rubrobacteraceae bacterium]
MFRLLGMPGKLVNKGARGLTPRRWEEVDMSQETPGLEQRGVDIVPKNERTVGFWDLFIIWGGFSIIMTNFLLGALGVGIGIVPAMIAHTIGILIVAGVVWLGTILGSEQGIAGTVAMRSAFGINGRYIASIVMFVVGVGWFGVQTGMVGSAAYEIVKKLVPAIAFTPRAWMVIMGVLMAVVAIYGYRAIVWLNRLAIPGLIVLLVWLTYKIVTVYSDELSAFQPSGELTFLAVINLLPAGMAAALILGADYGRYVKSERATLGAPLSVMIFFAIVALLGVVSAAAAGNWDPVQIFVSLGLGAFGLLMLILAAWTTNVTNIYVASLALSNMTGWLRVRTSIIASVVGILLGLAGIYSFQGLVNYLTLITALLIPTTGVLVVDYFIRNRRRILADELFKKEDSAYWFHRGWNIRAVIAWASGAIVTFAVPQSWIPAVSAMVVSGAVYYLLTMNMEPVTGREPTTSREQKETVPG